MKQILLFLIAGLGLTACNNTEANIESPKVAKQDPNARYFFNPPVGQPGHTDALPVGAPMLQYGKIEQKTTTTPSAPVVIVDPKDTRPNPKHGEPGHRCDIPVGAPLNTPAGQDNNQAVNTNVATPVTTVNMKDARPNPAHGQPGHRCDIPVGAPLNTPAPDNTKVAANTTPPPAPTPVYDPNDTRPNPAHGQPGHRCDIAVGLPLNTKSPQQKADSLAAAQAAVKGR